VRRADDRRYGGVAPLQAAGKWRSPANGDRPTARHTSKRMHAHGGTFLANNRPPVCVPQGGDKGAASPRRRAGQCLDPEGREHAHTWTQAYSHPEGGGARRGGEAVSVFCIAHLSPN
jgi:hypothetical protein